MDCTPKIRKNISSTPVYILEINYLNVLKTKKFIASNLTKHKLFCKSLCGQIKIVPTTSVRFAKRQTRTTLDTTDTKPILSKIF